MRGTRHDEVERKYAVAASTPVPDLTVVDGVARVRTRQTHELVATYFDTEDLDLLRNRTTVRRRVGGSDEGWHLKQPGGRDTRSETRLPLGRAAHTVPRPLRNAVAEHVGGRRLVPVGTVATRRTEHALVGEDGAELAVLAVDEVRAERLAEPRLRQHWHEWEVELSDGGHDLLDLVETVLLGAGAVPAAVSSKVARALAVESPGTASVPRPKDLHATRSTVGDAFGAYLAEHLEVLRRHTGGLPGETVHGLRVSARRLRSALSTYRPVLEKGAVDDLRDELRWLGRSLGRARDAEVLRAHLTAMADEEPDDPWAEPLAARIDADLADAHRAGRAVAAEAVASERYARLVRSLEAVAAGPPLRARGRRRARSELPRLLERDAKRARRAETAARATDRGPERDLALHEVRKKTKRLRYAAESAQPVLGQRAKRLARRARDVQDALGAHQDTVESRRWLSELAGREAGEPGIAFAAGRLHAREEARATASERDFRRAWQRLPHRRVDRWVRGR